MKRMYYEIMIALCYWLDDTGLTRAHLRSVRTCLIVGVIGVMIGRCI